MSKKLCEIITYNLVDFNSYILQAHSKYIIQTNLLGLFHEKITAQIFKCTLKTV